MSDLVYECGTCNFSSDVYGNISRSDLEYVKKEHERLHQGHKGSIVVRNRMVEDEKVEDDDEVVCGVCGGKTDVKGCDHCGGLDFKYMGHGRMKCVRCGKLAPNAPIHFD